MQHKRGSSEQQAEEKKPPSNEGKTLVEVHHVRRDAPKGAAFWEHPESWDDRREYYRHVATVGLPADEHSGVEEALETAWKRLQHGVGTPDAGVEEHIEDRRSTSVGDVMVIKDPIGEGENRKPPVPFEVGTVGFRDIEAENSDPSVGNRELLSIDASLEKE